MAVYRVSSYVQTLPLDDGGVLVGHPFFLEYAVLTERMLAAFSVLQEQPQTPESLSAKASLELDSVKQMLQFFRTRRFVLLDDEDETIQIKSKVTLATQGKRGDRAIVSGSRGYRDYSAIDLDVIKSKIPTEQHRDVKAVILGGCLAQLAASAMEQAAPAYGINLSIEANWPDRFASMSFDAVHLIIFQPFTLWLMAPFWDGAPFLSEEEREGRVHAMKDYLQVTLSDLLSRVKGRLLLVQGVSTPTFSPFGAAEFRQTHSFRRVVGELNQLIVDSIKDNPDAIFIDEEHVMANVGKLRLIDDSVALASHHGPLDSFLGAEPVGPSRKETFCIDEACQAPRLFAREYLSAFVRWAGIGRIKCIIVDLDNTLWPGVAGEEGFDLIGRDEVRAALWQGVFGGIHQALKILRQQGVLLAICSRQNEADVDRAWAQIESFSRDEEMKHLLCRDDFVMRKVNWERKSANIAEILEALGVAPDAALFIDDNAAERAEAQTVFPKLRTLGENLQLVRSTLLSDPCLQKDFQTSEGQSRTDMVKAQLQRETIRSQAVDGLAFLRGLDISLKITRIQSPEKIRVRVVELLQRTNQFNTTLVRLNGYELRELVNFDEGEIYTLEVKDRFASYGLVGVCLVRQEDIINFVMSCRVIPLSAAVPFLSSVLQHRKRIPVRGSIVEGPRNQPCRTLFTDAGFEEVENGKYELPDLSRLPAVDSTIYRVEFEEESTAHQRAEVSAAVSAVRIQSSVVLVED